ncbi:MAG: RDD family protein [Gammaproteobacteria bacterium]|nr:RDD family protein [Gammaproteobacteria bacterium]
MSADDLTEVNKVDSTLMLDTFTGVEIELQVAGVYIRGVARLIDDVIRFLVVSAMSVLLIPTGLVGIGLASVLGFFIWWTYNVLFEVLNNGVTPGKYYMGLRAVNADGTPIGWINSVIRSTLLVVDFLPFGYLIGIVTMALSRTQQRIGDIVAGTIVVYNRSRNTRKSADIRRASPIPDGLNADDQLLFLSFQERLSDLSPERAIELAETLEPLLGKNGQEAVIEVNAIAQGIRIGT